MSKNLNIKTIHIKLKEPVSALSQFLSPTETNLYILVVDRYPYEGDFLTINDIEVNKDNIIWYRVFNTIENESYQYGSFLYHRNLYDNRIKARLHDYLPIYSHEHDIEIDFAAEIIEIFHTGDGFNKLTTVAIDTETPYDNNIYDSGLLITVPDAMLLSDEEWIKYLEDNNES